MSWGDQPPDPPDEANANRARSALAVINALFSVYPRGVVYGAVWHVMSEFIREAPAGFRTHILSRLHQVADEADEHYNEECDDDLTNMDFH